MAAQPSRMVDGARRGWSQTIATVCTAAISLTPPPAMHLLCVVVIAVGFVDTLLRGRRVFDRCVQGRRAGRVLLAVVTALRIATFATWLMGGPVQLDIAVVLRRSAATVPGQGVTSDPGEAEPSRRTSGRGAES